MYRLKVQIWRANGVVPLEQVEISVLQRRVLRHGHLLIVVYHPFAVALDVSHVVSTSRVLANVRDSTIT